MLLKTVKDHSLTVFSIYLIITTNDLLRPSACMKSDHRNGQIKISAAHFIEGRCRSTTSTACTGLVLIGLSSSRGSGMLRPVSTSWSMCQLTKDTNLMETLKGRSFPPSPGRVTSRSTCGGGQEKRRARQDKVGYTAG